VTDIWVCSTCSSINRQRNDRCYKCGARQSEATGALADTRTTQAIQSRAVVRYRGSLIRAILAAGFIIAVAVLSVIVLNESLDAVRYLREQIPDVLQTGVIDEEEFARRAAGAVVPATTQTICAIGALLFFSAWLSRVVANIPALGGGTPGTTPTRAFVTPLIPVYNLFKTPPIIQDALYRLDPKAGGFFMILVAWIGLVGSWIVSFVVGWWVNLRILSVGQNAETLGEAIDGFQQAYDVQVVVDIITTLMVAAGAIVLVLVMFRIESRARARDREVRQAFAASIAAADTPVTVTRQPVEAPSAPPPAPAAAPAPGTAVGATALGAAPVLSGPRLHVIVAAEGITAGVDGSAPEPVTLEDLRGAASALAAAGGTAQVVTTDADVSSAATAREITEALRAAGVPTT
jgi:hypothetical protein